MSLKALVSYHTVFIYFFLNTKNYKIFFHFDLKYFYLPSKVNKRYKNIIFLFMKAVQNITSNQQRIFKINKCL